MVKEISSASEFNTEIKGPGLVVVDYFATWCGPCKQIAPFLEELSRKYPNVKFLKVDSDKVQEVTSERRISSLPTFQFFVKGNQVDEIKGADRNALEAKVIQHKCDPVDSFGGKKVTLGGSADATGPVVDPREARLRFMGLSVEPKPVENTKAAATATSDASGKNILLSDLLILIPWKDSSEKMKPFHITTHPTFPSQNYSSMINVDIRIW